MKSVRKNLQPPTKLSRVKAIIDSLPFQMAIIDSQGNITQVNSAWKEFARENGSDEGLEKGIGWNYLAACKAIRSHRGRKVVAGIEAVLAGETSEFHSEYPCHSQNQRRWFIMKVSALKGSQKGAVIAHFKITERVLAEKALRQFEAELLIARDAAIKSEQSKSEFLAQMSHEIRTPLNGIIGLLEILQDSSLDAAQRSTLQSLTGLSDHLLGIVNDILDLAKIVAGKLTLDEKNFNPLHIVEEVVSALRHVGEGKGLQLSYEAQPDFPTLVCGDPRRLRQILLNLAGNALKFTSEGSVHISAKISRTLEDVVHAEFSVIDSGMGISAESLSKLFHPFSQIDGGREASGNMSGTGLGLTISRRLAIAMGGTIEATSKPGKGSVFTVVVAMRVISGTLAIQKGVGTASVLEPKLAPAIESEIRPDWNGAPSKGTILVADDSVVIRKIMATILEKEGWAIRLAKNGRDALEQWEAGGFTALFMDCQMPVMDGYEAAQAIRLKELKSGAHIPVIAITADVLEENVQRCREVGMDEVLFKPFRRADVAELLNKLEPVGRN